MEPVHPASDYSSESSDGEFTVSHILKFPDSLAPDTIDNCIHHYSTLIAEYKQLCTENRQLRSGWADSKHQLTTHIRMLDLQLEQRQRLLDKQTGLVDILSSEKNLDDQDGVEGLEEYTSACDRCVYHKDMWRSIRAMNLEQQKRCEIESATVLAIQEQQGKQLAKIKVQLLRFKTKHDELLQIKTDPFCKDAEINTLREQLAESRTMTAAYNQTAFNANNEARLYLEQLEEEKQRGVALQATIDSLQAEGRLSAERIDVLLQMASSECAELFSVGGCSDLVCRNRQLCWSHRMNMANQEIGGLKNEIEILQEELSRAKGDSNRWRNQFDQSVRRDHGGTPCNSSDAPLDCPIASDTMRLSDAAVGSVVSMSSISYEEDSTDDDLLQSFHCNHNHQPTNPPPTHHQPA